MGSLALYVILMSHQQRTCALNWFGNRHLVGSSSKRRVRLLETHQEGRVRPISASNSDVTDKKRQTTIFHNNHCILFN